LGNSEPFRFLGFISRAILLFDRLERDAQSGVTVKNIFWVSLVVLNSTAE
jgi:hypothetical protein